MTSGHVSAINKPSQLVWWDTKVNHDNLVNDIPYSNLGHTGYKAASLLHTTVDITASWDVMVCCLVYRYLFQRNMLSSSEGKFVNIRVYCIWHHIPGDCSVIVWMLWEPQLLLFHSVWFVEMHVCLRFISGSHLEGWAPSAYLEPFGRRSLRSSQSVSSQDGSKSNVALPVEWM
jgi:hypothetical protein